MSVQGSEATEESYGVDVDQDLIEALAVCGIYFPSDDFDALTSEGITKLSHFQGLKEKELTKLMKMLRRDWEPPPDGQAKIFTIMIQNKL